MKGFVPVTKANLSAMVSNSLLAVKAQYEDKHAKVVAKYIEKEKARMTTRKWYRLWILPKARFAFNEPDIMEYSGSLSYPIFETCPFLTLECDRNNSIRWLQRLEAACLSAYSGEPIQIDFDTFIRISNPHIQDWCYAYNLAYTVEYTPE